jgi:signal transduction histidine kinase
MSSADAWKKYEDQIKKYEDAVKKHADKYASYSEHYGEKWADQAHKFEERAARYQERARRHHERDRARRARHRAARVARAEARAAASTAGAYPRSGEYLEPAGNGLRVKEWRPFRFVAGVVYVIIGIAFFLQSLGVWTVHAVDIWPLAIMAIGASALVGRAKRVRVEQDRSAQLVVAEERVRIARELHDIVAHSVSLMTVQIAAARRVQKSQPEEADRALDAAEQTGRQSLAELRGMLATLRGADASIAAATPGRAAGGVAGQGRAPLPGLTDLEALVSSARDAGLDVTMNVIGDPPRISASVGLAVYRVVQEALTNVMRHAGGPTRVSVEVTYAPDAIMLFVDDEGTGGTGRHSDGHGILGMRERVWAVDGTLDAGPRQPGPGWRVRARIPVMEGPP